MVASQQILAKSVSTPCCSKTAPEMHYMHNHHAEPEAEPHARSGHLATVILPRNGRPVARKLLRTRSCPVVHCGVKVELPTWLDVILRTLRGSPVRVLRRVAKLAPAAIVLAVIYRQGLARLARLSRQQINFRRVLLLSAAWCARESCKFPRCESAASLPDGSRMVAQFVGDLLLAPLRCFTAAEVPALRFQPSEANKGIVSKCPSLKQFKQTPLFRSPWLAFAMLMVRDFKGNDTSLVRRELIEAGDGVLAIDWWAESEKTPEEAPILFIGTTFTGDALPTISRSVARHFAARGWRCVAFTKRGCGLTMPNLQPPESDTTWCFGGFDDLKLAIDYVASSFPRAQICGVGFSLGAAQLRNYMCATGAHCKLAACVCMDASNEWVSCVDSADRRMPLIMRILAQAAMTTLDHCTQLGRQGRDLQLKNMFALVQQQLAPQHGYGSSEHDARRYLLSCNPAPYRGCERPVLELMNYTDFLTDVHAVNQMMALFPAESERVICCATRTGTHVVRWEGLRMRCWASRAAFEFLSAALGPK